MARAGVLAGALLLGGAVGLLNSAISGWVHAFISRDDPDAAWRRPTVFALQFFLRVLLGFLSLYGAYRFSGGDPVAVFLNLAGLLGARYHLLWRVARGG